MTALPNVVLVHGARADGSCWDAVIENLQADGYNVTDNALNVGDQALSNSAGHLPGRAHVLMSGDKLHRCSRPRRRQELPPGEVS